MYQKACASIKKSRKQKTVGSEVAAKSRLKSYANKPVPSLKNPEDKKTGGVGVLTKSRPYEHSSSGESLKTHLVSFCPASGAAPYELAHSDLIDAFSLGDRFF